MPVIHLPPCPFGPKSLFGRFFSGQRGITLIEVIVSIAILGIIVIPLSTLFSSSLRMTADSKAEMLAVQLAQKKMEKLKALPFGEALNAELGTFEEDGFTVTARIDPVGTYTIPTGEELSGDFDVVMNLEDDTYGGIVSEGIARILDSSGTELGSLAFSDDIGILITADKSAGILIITGYSSGSGSESGGTFPEITLPFANGSKIKIRVNCRGTIPVDVAVSFSSEPEDTKPDMDAELFLVGTDSSAKPAILTKSGYVRVHYNLYDKTVVKPQSSLIYQLTVTVSKTGSPEALTEITGLKAVN